MAVTLMKKFNEIILPENLRKEIIRSFKHHPFHPDVNNLSGYGVLLELSLGGEDEIASKLLKWSIKNEPFENRKIEEYNKKICALANDY